MVKKTDNKTGFLATRYKDNQVKDFELKESSLNSYKNQKSPRASRVFFYKTKAFSEIAKDKTIPLQKRAVEIFANELSRE